MAGELLLIDPQKCTGCRECEIVCAIRCTGYGNPAHSRIQVAEWGKTAFFVPVSCRQCEEAPCMKACPREAIYSEAALHRIMVDFKRCVSCRMCVAACPFGAMRFDTLRQTVFKCDLCEGDPQCVRFCYPGALRFAPPEALQYERIRRTAWQQTGLKEKGAWPTSK